MSTAAPAKHKFLVYAPDKTEEGTFEKRLSVRPKHIEVAHERNIAGIVKLGGAVLTPESISSPTAQKKMVGSAFIFEAESLEEVKKMVEGDIYYTSGVWDPEKIIILPFVNATPMP
ncbi:hypothetical protein CC1G_02054 [Coprinopsis cinerea okayama7|uniref:YCII-related domain-containing protein n=1 Tax=Coprinopsis cinerea (strain Okayama-7 / 130 / ATCC MYA-4618 / FGSC 9003) TaxID=240176 RepID=A8N6F0_COPC7|nr:hypothetical protein CC1G_02054 [Coprinopsis cinerea okayama7\|eukprot:XP_001830418.1 hypothetical protein CC1G_02054 [Coprinopsis cinerea okayama7\